MIEGYFRKDNDGRVVLIYHWVVCGVQVEPLWDKVPIFVCDKRFLNPRVIGPDGPTGETLKDRSKRVKQTGMTIKSPQEAKMFFLIGGMHFSAGQLTLEAPGFPTYEGYMATKHAEEIGELPEWLESIEPKVE